MKITNLVVTPIAFADPPLRSSFGRHAPYALRTIVELVSEDGVSGFGETIGGEQVVRDIESVRDVVLGRDAFDLARMRQDIDETFSPGRGDGQDLPSGDRSQNFILPGASRLDVPLRVFSALETAALDLIGKSLERPVYDLLGGRARDAARFSAYLFFKHAGGGGERADARDDYWGEALDPAGIARQARRMTEEYGFGSVKLKAGVLPPDDEIEAVAALRDELGPSVPIRIDPNAAWTVETSLRVMGATHGDIEYLEDPTPGLPGMAQVREGLLAAGIPTPLASNMAVTSFADVPEAIRTDAAQVILGDHHYWGGMRAIAHLGTLCEVFGLGLSMHSNSHLGVSLMAMAHLAVATPHLSYDCDTHYPWLDERDEILVGGKIRIQDGAVTLTGAPGLGVEIDRDSLARGQERYRTCDYRIRDDVAEMRKHVDPEWERIIPRW